MKRISSKYTFFYKRLFPVFWFAIVALVVVVPLVQPSARRPGPEIILMPAFMGIIGFVVMKRLIFGLVDEAWDDGDSLVFRNASQEVRVYLKDIKNVNYQLFVNPPRITVLPRQQTAFGDQISFYPSRRPRLLDVIRGRNGQMMELIDRIDRARIDSR